MQATKRVHAECVEIMGADDATDLERDAASEVVNTGKVDAHLASVLQGYVCKQLAQNRWGK